MSLEKAVERAQRRMPPAYRKLVKRAAALKEKLRLVNAKIGEFWRPHREEIGPCPDPACRGICAPGESKEGRGFWCTACGGFWTLTDREALLGRARRIGRK